MAQSIWFAARLDFLVIWIARRFIAIIFPIHPDRFAIRMDLLPPLWIVFEPIPIFSRPNRISFQSIRTVLQSAPIFSRPIPCEVGVSPHFCIFQRARPIMLQIVRTDPIPNSLNHLNLCYTAKGSNVSRTDYDYVTRRFNASSAGLGQAAGMSALTLLHPH